MSGTINWRIGVSGARGGGFGVTLSLSKKCSNPSPLSLLSESDKTNGIGLFGVFCFNRRCCRLIEPVSSAASKLSSDELITKILKFLKVLRSTMNEVFFYAVLAKKALASVCVCMNQQKQKSFSIVGSDIIINVVVSFVPSSIFLPLTFRSF